MCVLYGKPKQTRDQKDTLTITGYINWKRATRPQWCVRTDLKPHRSKQLLAANFSEIVDHRKYLRHKPAVTAFLGKQGIAFHGHSRASDRKYYGVLWSACSFLRSLTVSCKHTKHHHVLPTFHLHPKNEMIQSTSGVITSRIISEIKQVLIYSIMVDESMDHQSCLFQSLYCRLGIHKFYQKI